MKKLLFIIISSSLISCSVKKTLVIPKSYSLNTPELETINNSEIGITLVSKETGYQYNAIKISKGGKSSTSVNREIKEGNIFIHKNDTKKHNLYSLPEDTSFGIAIPKNGEDAVFYVDRLSILLIPMKEEIEYEKTFATELKKDYLNKNLFIMDV